MNKLTAQETKYNAFKWSLATLIIIVGIAGNMLFFELPVVFRGIGLGILAVIVLLILYQTSQGKKTWAFLQDARLELRKMVWPSRQETVQTTLVVLGMVLAMIVLLAVIDSILFRLMKFITNIGG